MEIKILELAGFEPSFRAMRLPYNSNHKSDSFTQATDYDLPWDRIGPKDLLLMQKLIKAGDEHAKSVRGIKVWMEIAAPWYWFNELDTYVIGTTPLGSTSTMHGEGGKATGVELQRIKGDIRGDHEYIRIRDFNYQTLRRIHRQRKGHRLPEWQTFSTCVETLPLANELILI